MFWLYLQYNFQFDWSATIRVDLPSTKGMSCSSADFRHSIFWKQKFVLFFFFGRDWVFLAKGNFTTFTKPWGRFPCKINSHFAFSNLSSL